MAATTPSASIWLNPRFRFDKLTRYETHLDRKLQRVLTLLLQLQAARRTISGATA